MTVITDDKNIIYGNAPFLKKKKDIAENSYQFSRKIMTLIVG